ncbi:hypothetical protein RB195_017236 [Necator americanus]|uniref:Secreted protein n=1 Tax=Necator americanus TaxID=51031 RepID=A0ABR1C4B8_NECAM
MDRVGILVTAIHLHRSSWSHLVSNHCLHPNASSAATSPTGNVGIEVGPWRTAEMGGSRGDPYTIPTATHHRIASGAVACAAVRASCRFDPTIPHRSQLLPLPGRSKRSGERMYTRLQVIFPEEKRRYC